MTKLYHFVKIQDQIEIKNDWRINLIFLN